jgi:hypothetical protein
MESHKIHVPNHQPVYVAKPKQLSSSRGCGLSGRPDCAMWFADGRLALGSGVFSRKCADVKLKVGIPYGYKYIYNYDICI